MPLQLDPSFHKKRGRVAGQAEITASTAVVLVWTVLNSNTKRTLVPRLNLQPSSGRYATDRVERGRPSTPTAPLVIRPSIRERAAGFEGWEDQRETAGRAETLAWGGEERPVCGGLSEDTPACSAHRGRRGRPGGSSPLSPAPSPTRLRLLVGNSRR